MNSKTSAFAAGGTGNHLSDQIDAGDIGYEKAERRASTRPLLATTLGNQRDRIIIQVETRMKTSESTRRG